MNPVRLLAAHERAWSSRPSSPYEPLHYNNSYSLHNNILHTISLTSQTQPTPVWITFSIVQHGSLSVLSSADHFQYCPVQITFSIVQCRSLSVLSSTDHFQYCPVRDTESDPDRGWLGLARETNLPHMLGMLVHCTHYTH